jgi:FkbM family methyltransferase
MKPFLSVRDIRDLSSYEFESACRNYCSFARLEESTGLVRILTQYKMFIDVRDVSLVPHLVMDGYWETPVTQCFSRLIREGDVCIDVGAHLGYFSVLMSALSGGEGRTLAVEPNPSVAALLRKTSEINFPGFEVWEGALSNSTCELDIYIPKDKTGDSSLLVRAESAGAGLTHQRVFATTMDQLLSNKGDTRVDVIKIDAEGAEPAILEGMSEILKQNPDVKIVMEYSPHLYTNVGAFNTFLTSRFDLYRISVAFVLEKIDAVKIEALSLLRSHVDLLLLPKGGEVPY